MPDLKHVELELLPVDKSSALHTLLESVMGSADHRLSSSEVKLDNIPPQPNIPRSYFPERLPSLHSPSQVWILLLVYTLKFYCSHMFVGLHFKFYCFHMFVCLFPHVCVFISCLQAPERVVRDSNLSVISSLSLENCSSTHFQSPDVSLQEVCKVCK